ncbi:hypothetical protein CK203_106957 [Vitis vinifera]|uniref:Uncharacterized protein n=1 Tax=Vitis vinifera TaxID=29760 RepID=A0A438FE80_VITVI|nr:hypothetical protein CK203_106957 [Vitis vinifera]
MHYCAKYFPPAYKDRPSHGFIAYSQLCWQFQDLSEAFVGQYLSSSEASVQALHFSNHWAKKSPTTMDDLFRRANKYSMLEDDVRAATQQVLVAGRPSRGNSERNTKPSDWPKQSDRRQEGPSRPEMPSLTPLSISYEKFLPDDPGLVRLQVA